jgi:hypothetical protein
MTADGGALFGRAGCGIADYAIRVEIVCQPGQDMRGGRLQEFGAAFGG